MKQLVKRLNCNKGVTMIELAVVLAIIGIMSLFMTPGIGEWVQNYRIKQAARDMASDFQFAKLKAISISRQQYCTVTFTIALNGVLYDYIIYSDDNHNLAYDGGEEIFKSVILESEHRNVTLDSSQGGGNGITFGSNANSQPSVGFDSRGLPRDTQGNFQNGTVFMINSITNKGRRVDVTAAGAVSITEYQ
jgi:prepilin-type N-terminal cleavage/methylation domain-containing protein